MIIITTYILSDEDGSGAIAFAGHDQNGCTVLEGDIADRFKKALIETREQIFKEHPELVSVPTIDEYKRQFKHQKDRDQHYNENERNAEG